jgi:hypothetical protein
LVNLQPQKHRNKDHGFKSQLIHTKPIAMGKYLVYLGSRFGIFINNWVSFGVYTFLHFENNIWQFKYNDSLITIKNYYYATYNQKKFPELHNHFSCYLFA